MRIIVYYFLLGAYDEMILYAMQIPGLELRYVNVAVHLVCDVEVVLVEGVEVTDE